MDTKQILVIFGCVWATIAVSLGSWYLFKWLFTQGLMLGAVKKAIKLFSIASLLVICSCVYTFIVHYTIKYDLITAVKEAWKQELVIARR